MHAGQPGFEPIRYEIGPAGAEPRPGFAVYSNISQGPSMLKKILAILFMFFTAVAMAAVDLNKATEAELDSVKGIGPVTSKLIMSERKKGEFKDWQDFINRVKGIGDSRAAKLSAEGLTLNGATYKVAKEKKKETKVAAKEVKKEAKAEAAKPAASAKK
jgi:competence protein ComEA